MTRYKKIVKEAAEQSYREIIPEIYEPSSLEAIIEATKNYSVKLVAYEEEAKKDQTTYTFSEELQKLRKNDEIVIFIGPEDRKSTRLNSSHVASSYAVFCLKK